MHSLYTQLCAHIHIITHYVKNVDTKTCTINETNSTCFPFHGNSSLIYMHQIKYVHKNIVFKNRQVIQLLHYLIYSNGVVFIIHITYVISILLIAADTHATVRTGLCILRESILDDMNGIVTRGRISESNSGRYLILLLYIYRC